MKRFSFLQIKCLACIATAGFVGWAMNPHSALAAGEAPPADLFADAGMAADLQPSGLVLRQHAVRINRDALKTAINPGALLHFNLFPGTGYTGVVETVETRGETGLTLVGHLQGREVSSFVLVANQDVVVMNLRPDSRGLSQVRYLGGGVHLVQQLDETLFPPCEAAPTPPIRNSAAAASIQSQGAPAGDPGDVIDVMVLYTPSARIAAGGTNAIQALITLAFVESNTAYQQSLINPRIRLVYQAEIAYTETPTASGGFLADLNHLTDPQDGFIDEVLGLRYACGADLVSLWINNSDSCGIGWLMDSLSPSFESDGYNVVHYGCATGNYSFAHELGHNMGCQHDRENAGSPGLYSYSYGWRFTGTDAIQYRTIMSYDPGIRIQRFSNPNVSYMGTPTGVAVGDPNESYNALTINNSASTVANFRQSVPSTNQPPSIDIQPASQAVPVGANVTFSVQVSGSLPFVYQWRTNNVPIPGANLDHYSITNVQFSSAANYSVFVTNTFGTATSSNATLTVTDIGNAVDAPALSWTTGGDAVWFGQTTTTHDGIDAAESGHIGNSQSNWVQTTVTGPGALTFWWKVSSETNFDKLVLYTNGVAVPNGFITGEVDWQFQTVPAPSGTTTIRWQYEKDLFDFPPVGQDRGWLDQVSFSKLGDAVENPGLTWVVTGNALWIPQTTTTHDGVDAAASGSILDSQLTRMSATVNGPATLKFWWKVSSEPNDNLRFFTNGTQVFAIHGEQDWQQRTVNLSPGPQLLSWKYDKDASFFGGQDKSWVDQIVVTAPSRVVSNSFVNGPNAPQFSLQFTGQVGGSYTIQASTNLQSWENLTNIISSSLTMPFVETGVTNFNQRFYRVVSP